MIEYKIDRACDGQDVFFDGKKVGWLSFGDLRSLYLAQPIASRDMLRTGVDEAIAGLEGQRYSRPALADAIEEYGGGQDEKERAAFAAAVSDWRKGGEDASP